MTRLTYLGALLAAFSACSTGAAAATCESLTTLTLPHAAITLAENVSGQFTPPATGGGGPAPRAIANLPSFCRVTATLRPTPDSDIRIEVWLPASGSGAHGWNGKLQSVGNGAWAGVIPYPAIGAALAGGYATAGTDTGHVGNTARFAVGHGAIDRTRPLCPYPQVAAYKGTGSIDEAARFVCKAP